MILGRPSNLILGAFTALFNVIVLVANSQSATPIFTTELVAAVNIAAGAIIGLVANQTPTVNSGSQVNVITPAGQPNETITV